MPLPASVRGASLRRPSDPCRSAPDKFRSLYRTGSIVLSATILALGVVMIVATLVRGGGALASGILLGLLFTALGAGRLYLWRKSS